MHPVLIAIPALDITLRSHAAMVALAVILCLWIGPRWTATLEGLARSRVRLAMLALGLAAFTGGRLHSVLAQWSTYAHRPLAALTISSGNLHAGGAIAAVAIAVPLLLSRFGIPAGKFADGFAPTLGIGIAVARLGCFLQGCCSGALCRWPWCITFPRSAYVHYYHAEHGIISPGALRSAPVHPLQLYFAAAGLLLTALALWLHPRKQYDGQVGLVVLVVYGLSAAGLEFFRGRQYPRTYWGPLPQLEWIALALTVAGTAALTAAALAHRRGHAPAGRSHQAAT